MKSLSFTAKENGKQFVGEVALRTLPGKRIVAKGMFDNVAAVAKCFFQKAKAASHVKRELAGYSALVKAGITTPAMLFSGEREGDNYPVIVFEYIQSTADSRAVWNSYDKKARLDFLFSVVGLLALQHQAGLCQHDLHPSNYIIAEELCYVLDPGSVVQHAAPLDKKACLDNLGELFSQIAIPFDESALDAYQYYCKKQGWSFDAKDFEQVKASQQRYRDHRQEKYLEKLGRPCTRFVCETSFTKHLACWRPLYTPAMQKTLADCDTAVKAGEIIKAGNSNTIVKVAVDGEAYVIKRYNIKNMSARLKRLFLKNRAQKSWENAGRLFFHHVPTPMPVALVEDKLGPFRGKVFFVSCFVEGMSLGAFLSQNSLSEVEKKRAMEGVKVIFQSLKRLRLSHGDLKATNFLVTENEVMITDLDAMRYHDNKHALLSALIADKERFLANWRHEIEYVDAFTDMLEDVI